MKKWRVVVSVVLTLGLAGWGQTIEVDATHPTNHFVPRETLGAGVDRIPVEAIDKDLVPPALDAALSSGWQPVTYRQNTELAVEAWHWNPQGTWSAPSGKGYFTGATTLGEPIRYSYGYRLPRRGFTRNDGTENAGFSRLTDGDRNSFWKSNPYLTQRFTGESDALHPQWVVIDLAQVQMVNTIRIVWGEPYAARYVVQYWADGDDPIKAPTRGTWEAFQNGEVDHGTGGTATLVLNHSVMPVRLSTSVISIRIFDTSPCLNATSSAVPPSGSRMSSCTESLRA